MKAVKFIFAAVAVFSGVQTSANPFAGSVDLGGGNRYLSWFDYFNDQFYPWVYHFEHGWLYCASENASSLWLWNPGIGWVWTGRESYPNLYEQNRGWIYYARGSANPRWFFDRTPEEWVSDAVVASSATYFPVPLSFETYTWQYSVNNGQPVGGQVDEVALFFTFLQYDLTFTGSNLVQRADINASVGGSVYAEGTYYPVTGYMSALETSHFVRDALGVYIDNTMASLNLGFSVAGNDFLVKATAVTNIIGELLVSLPWRSDLFEFPVGTVYDQWLPNGWVSGNYKFWVNNNLEESQDFSMGFSPAVRYELIDKRALYFLNGKAYNNVVVIRASILTPDPFGGPAEYLDTEMWLAPGVGLIRSLQEDAMLNEPVELVLLDTNLW